MKITSAVFPAAFLAISMMMSGCIELGNSNQSSDENSNTGPGQGIVRGAPGPIAGAGLPIVAAGFGIYWLVRRRRRNARR